jgi:hypothetical protein
MNSWWLKLYTIPSLKKIAVVFLLVMIIVCCGFKFMPEKILLFYGAYFSPFLVFFGLNSEGMYANLDFHKMSVPLKDLRKAYFADLAIQLFAFFLMALFSLVLPLYLFIPDKVFVHALSKMGLPLSLFLMVTVAFVSFLISFKSMKMKLNSHSSKVELSKKQKKAFIFFLAPIIYFIMFDNVENPSSAGAWLEQFNILFIISTIFTSTIVASIFHFAIFKFHVIRAENNFKGHAFTYSSAFMGTVAFCLMCGLIFRFEVNGQYYPVSSKAKALLVFSDFLPVLEPDTAKEILNASSFFAEDVFRNADPEVYQMPVEDFLQEKSLAAYAQYLRWGKPSERNLVYIMNELEENPKAKDWKEFQSYREVKYRLVQHWPNAKSLPDGLIKEKIVTNKAREVATEKKGP